MPLRASSPYPAAKKNRGYLYRTETRPVPVRDSSLRTAGRFAGSSRPAPFPAPESLPALFFLYQIVFETLDDFGRSSTQCVGGRIFRRLIDRPQHGARLAVHDEQVALAAP